MPADPVRLASSILLLWLLAPSGLAAEPAPAGDVGAMTMEQLLAAFHDNTVVSRPVPQRRVDVINALRRVGPPLIEAMRGELEQRDPEVRGRALRVLVSLGNGARPLVKEVMAAAAGDGEPRVRAAAIQVLCQLRYPSAFGVLVQATRDPDPGVRSAVIRHGRAALADAPFALAVVSLGDKDLHVRVAAVEELRWLKEKRAVAYLTPLLDDRTVLHHDTRNGVTTDHRMCDAAVEALEFLVNGVYLLPGEKTQADYDALVERWREWAKEKGRAYDEALYAEPELKRADR